MPFIVTEDYIKLSTITAQQLADHTQYDTFGEAKKELARQLRIMRKKLRRCGHTADVSKPLDQLFSTVKQRGVRYPGGDGLMVLKNGKDYRYLQIHFIVRL